MNYLVGEVNDESCFQTFRGVCDSSGIWAKRKESKELGDAQARSMIRGTRGGPCAGDHGPCVWMEDGGGEGIRTGLRSDIV